MKIKSFTIYDWMTELKLNGNELLTYAIMYETTNAGEFPFDKRSGFLIDILGVSRPYALKILQNLTDMGLITKFVPADAKNVNAYKLSVDKIPNVQ